MIFSRAMLCIGFGVSLLFSATSLQWAAAQNESSYPVDLDSLRVPSQVELPDSAPAELPVQVGSSSRSLEAMIEDAVESDRGIRETKFKLKVLADNYFNKAEQIRKKIQVQKVNLRKLKPLLEEAQSSGSVEKNGQSMTIDKLRGITDKSVTLLQVENEKLRRNEVITKKLQDFYGSLNTACEKRREICKSAELRVNEIRQSVTQSQYDCETAYLHAKRYLSEGMKIDAASQEFSSGGGGVRASAEQVGFVSRQSVAFELVVGELSKLADKLETQGQIDEAASLRAQVSKLQISK